MIPNNEKSVSRPISKSSASIKARPTLTDAQSLASNETSELLDVSNWPTDALCLIFDGNSTSFIAKGRDFDIKIPPRFCK